MKIKYIIDVWLTKFIGHYWETVLTGYDQHTDILLLL